MSIAIYIIGTIIGGGLGVGLGYMNKRSQEQCGSPT